MDESRDVIEVARTGEKFVFLKRARDTDGELFEIEFFVREFALVAARPHIHATGEERVELIAGTARMRIGREERILGPGEAVVIPAGMVHSIRREGEEFLRFRMQMRPAMKTETMFETGIGLHRDGRALRTCSSRWSWPASTRLTLAAPRSGCRSRLSRWGRRSGDYSDIGRAMRSTAGRRTEKDGAG